MHMRTYGCTYIYICMRPDTHTYSHVKHCMSPGGSPEGHGEIMITLLIASGDRLLPLHLVIMSSGRRALLGDQCCTLCTSPRPDGSGEVAGRYMLSVCTAALTAHQCRCCIPPRHAADVFWLHRSSELLAMSSYATITMFSSGTPLAFTTWYAWHTSAWWR